MQSHFKDMDFARHTSTVQRFREQSAVLRTDLLVILALEQKRRWGSLVDLVLPGKIMLELA